MHRRLILVASLLAGCIQAPAESNSPPSAADLGADVSSPSDAGRTEMRDEGPTPSDASPPSDVSQPDMAPDLAGADAAAPDIGPDLPPGEVVVLEVEPNPAETPQTLPALPLAIDGSVTSDNADWFSVELPAASALQVTIVEGDVNWVEFGAFSGVPKRGFSGGVDSTRQFFVPATGSYQIGVISSGDPFDYRIRFEIIPNLVASPLPTAQVTDGVLVDGQVQVWSWTAPGSGLANTGVDALGTGIDPFLFVLDRATGQYLAQDQAGETEMFAFDRDDAREYWIVVDVYELLSLNAPYHIMVNAL